MLAKILVFSVLAAAAVWQYTNGKQNGLGWSIKKHFATVIVIFMQIAFAEICFYLVNLFRDWTFNGENNPSETFINHLSLNLIPYISFGVCLLLLIIFAIFDYKMMIEVLDFTSTFIWMVLLCIFSLKLLNFITTEKETELTEMQQINSMKGLDYGTSMAASYFYGYLRIILPANGIDFDGIKVSLERYENSENVTVPVKKLFILIPTSGFIPPNLAEASDDWLENAKTLQQIRRDRAGSKGRPYMNTMYKIHPGGIQNNTLDPIYICVEGASPLLTFYEVVQHSHIHSDMYKKYRSAIIKSFQKSLQDFLDENVECGKYCELVYYDDKNGENPAKVLLDLLEKKYEVNVR